MGMPVLHPWATALWLNIQGDTTLGRYNRNPRMRVQKAENVTKALDFIQSRGVRLTNIGPEGLLSVSTFPKFQTK